MNSQTYPETLQENSLLRILRDKNARNLAKIHKLETELRLIRKRCFAEYANDPRLTTLECVNRTMLQLQTCEENLPL